MIQSLLVLTTPIWGEDNGKRSTGAQISMPTGILPTPVTRQPRREARDPVPAPVGAGTPIILLSYKRMVNDQRQIVLIRSTRLH
jgi:hypothetical protein